MFKMFKILILAIIVGVIKAQSQVYGQCGGIGWKGPTTCVTGSKCAYINPYHSQCLPGISGLIPINGQCGGLSWAGPNTCEPGLVCQYINDYYFQCLPIVSEGETSTTKTTSQILTTLGLTTNTSTIVETTNTSTNVQTTNSITTNSTTTKDYSAVIVAIYGQCGGIGWTGPTTCVTGSKCAYINPYHSQCLPGISGLIPINGQCGGLSWAGPNTCEPGLVCQYINDYYFQCLPIVSEGETSTTKTTSQILTTLGLTTNTSTIVETTNTSTNVETTNTSTNVQTTNSITTNSTTTKDYSAVIVAIYGQCGGIGWTGPTTCVTGSKCAYINPYHSQCLPGISGLIPINGQCGGLSWAGPNTCEPGLVCQYINDYYFQCLPIVSEGETSTTKTTSDSITTNSTTTKDYSAVIVAIYGQCGGIGWNGSKICDSGLVCQYINDSYYQCLVSGSQALQASVTTTYVANGTSSLASNGTLASVTDSIFPGKTFKHGIVFDGSMKNTDYQNNDYISIRINSPWSDQPSKTDFNPLLQGAMVQKCKQFNKLPLFYAYVIAFEARAKQGLQDCDVDPSKNLCYQGANFIRNNRALLVSRYTHQATEIAKALGDSNAPCVFVMEPDLWQYYGDNRQQGGPLSGDYMRLLYDDFAIEIRKQLPNAKISWDLSAWIKEDGMTTWWGFFKTSSYVDFVHTSGGQGQAASDYFKPNELKWSDFSRITGKRIIADCGYGIGGGSSSNCGAWTLDNKKLRIADGVIALSGAQGAKQSPPNMDRLPLP